MGMIGIDVAKADDRLSRARSPLPTNRLPGEELSRGSNLAATRIPVPNAFPSPVRSVTMGARPWRKRGKDGSKEMGRLKARLIVPLLLGVFLISQGPCLAQKGGPSPAFRAELQKTLEKKRQRRARRGESRAPNAIVPWPMPPALIIRATPEVHDEVEGLLKALRRAP
jgi:hypothetical protein